MTFGELTRDKYVNEFFTERLPEDLIATRPLPRREDSRMMVLHRDTEKIEHRQFKELRKRFFHRAIFWF